MNKRNGKLPKNEQEVLLLDLINALTLTKSVNETVLFLQDLLTKNEIEILSKRLRIAKLLLNGVTYDEITEKLHTSLTTIAKVAAWLAERGDGFRNIISKLPKEENNSKWKEFSEWDQMKRKYSLYFWPELLLEEIIKTASKPKKERMKKLLDSLDEKNELHKRLEHLLKSELTTTLHSDVV